MKETKNIDQMFQEKLKNLEATPSPEVWNNIEAKLKKKKRRILPMWWFSGGVAAILVVGFLMYPLFIKNNNTEEINTPIIVDVPESDLKKEIENNDSILNRERESIEVVITEKEKKSLDEESELLNAPIAERKVDLVNQKKSIEKKEKATGSEGLTPVDKNAMKKNSFALLEEKTQNNKQKKNKKDSINVLTPKKDFIAEISSKDTILSEKKNHSKWALSPTVALLATNSFSSTSSLDNSLNSSSTQGSNSFSYGVKVAYQINDKWSIQSGIHLQNLDYLNKNLSIVSSISESTLSNIDYNNENLFSINSPDAANNLTSGANIITNEATVTQAFGYIEIPLEVQYSFFRSNKFNTKIVTGFSSLILQKNEIVISSSTINRVIGKANNLNTLNFSGNVGLDVDYSINKKLQLNFNPMFKIQMNTFSKNSNGFKPYSIGFYTGIKYQF